jgi:hypothetical protein
MSPGFRLAPATRETLASQIFTWMDNSTLAKRIYAASNGDGILMLTTIE